MTGTVPKIAFRQAISGVLAEHGIDDFELEMHLTESMFGFYQRLADGENPLLVQGDMVDSYLATHAEEKFRAELIQRIGKSLGININREDLWEETIKFLTKQEKEKGQTIEGFKRWLDEYTFGPPVWKIGKDPTLIIENWPTAYPEAIQKELFKSESGGFDF